MIFIVRTIKEYKNGAVHTTKSFWEWCATKRKNVKFKPNIIVSIQHSNNENPYSLIPRNTIFSILMNNNIRHAIYGEGDEYISILLKGESDAALLKLML